MIRLEVSASTTRRKASRRSFTSKTGGAHTRTCTCTGTCTCTRVHMHMHMRMRMRMSTHAPLHAHAHIQSVDTCTCTCPCTCMCRSTAPPAAAAEATEGAADGISGTSRCQPMDHLTLSAIGRMTNAALRQKLEVQFISNSFAATRQQLIRDTLISNSSATRQQLVSNSSAAHQQLISNSSATHQQRIACRSLDSKRTGKEMRCKRA